jgi:protein-arginine kinase activator protein McsA
VARWCEKANVKALSPERAERCAWLTGSCAKKTVELLNAQADGAFKAAYPLPKEVEECRSCHDQGSKLEDARGKMECDSCHFTLGTRHPIIERTKF